jgi:hypothetical protein
MNIDNETRHALMASCDNLLFGDERMRFESSNNYIEKSVYKKSHYYVAFQSKIGKNYSLFLIS